MQNTESVKTVERFFEALYELKRRKAIRGISAFSRIYGINKGGFYKLEKDKTRDILQLVWLSHLVTDFGVSADWLLTGNGDMFTPKSDDMDAKLQAAFWLK